MILAGKSPSAMEDHYAFLLSSLNINFNSSYNSSNDTDFDGLLEEQDIAKYEDDLLKYYMMGIGAMTVCCLGVIGNILSVIVLTQKSMRSSSTYAYLSALAVCDTFVLFFTMLVLLNDTRKPIKGVNQWPDTYYAYMFPIVHPAVFVFQVTSIWLTLAFTVDRYIMICHPFRAEKWCSVKRARTVVICLWVAGLLFNIPKFLEYYTKVIEVETMNGTKQELAVHMFTDLGKNPLFKEVVHSWLYLICVCSVPFLSLAVLNSFLIHAVHLSRKKGKELNAKEKHRNDTTIMLIGVVIIFLICQGPALVSRMIWAFDTETAVTRDYFTVNEVANFMVILNSAINIVPYYFFGKKFQREFWRVFCSCFLDSDELRKLKRNLSFSFDTRRPSTMSTNNTAPGGGSGPHSIRVFQNKKKQEVNGNHKNCLSVPLIEIAHETIQLATLTDKDGLIQDKSVLMSSLKDNPSGIINPHEFEVNLLCNGNAIGSVTVDKKGHNNEVNL